MDWVRAEVIRCHYDCIRCRFFRVGDFRRLLAWQSADCLCTAVYAALRHFPADERFALTAQLRRAAVSVPTNLAEGQAAYGVRERLRYTGIAAASLTEVGQLVHRARRCGYLSREQHQDLTRLGRQAGLLVYGLLRSLRKLKA